VVHRQIPEDPHLKLQWNNLVEQMERPEVFYTQEWAWAMQQAYGSSLIPFLVLAFEEDALLGVGSLATDAEQRNVTFLAATTADYCEFLCHASHLETFVDGVFSELARAGIQRVELANLPADSPAIAVIRVAAPKHGYQVFFRPAYLCARVELGTSDPRSALKGKFLGKNMFRRSVNRLGKEGPIALRHARSWNEIEPLLPTFAVAHVARFLATGRVSNLVRAERRRFLEELAEALSLSGWVTLDRLMVGDRAAAWNYGFQFRGSWFWYQPTFESKLEAHSPGYCLLTMIISEACDINEMRVVDLGLGAEGYKERFSNGTRATLHGTMTPSLRSHWTAMARYGLASLVKRSPWLESTLRGLIRRAAAVSRRIRTSGVRGFLAWGLTRLRHLIFSRDEVLFYRWLPGRPPKDFPAEASSLHLSPLDLDALAAAAIRFEGDAETYDYLLRSAARLRERNARGFALRAPEGCPVHFCWVGSFAGFFMDELKVRLEAPAPTADIIFDCWTPSAVRGNHYYATTVARTAEQLVREGRDPWIFSAATNTASVHGLESSGFERHYSMVRRKTLLVQKVTKIPCAASTSEVPANS
jgi:CelD/BcsL family acetyltransferase involved in cellulose biosynthesis